MSELKFKVGDEVRIIDGIESCYGSACPHELGQIHVIDDIDDHADHLAYRVGTSAMGWWYSRKDLELVTEEEAEEETNHKHKIGDMVTILDATMTDFENGDEGVITYIDEDSTSLPYKVENSSTHNWFCDDEIELAQPALVFPHSGPEVSLSEATLIPEWFLQPGAGFPVTVKDPEETPHVYKVDDVVTVVNAKGTCFFDGEQGTITAIEPLRAWPYTVVNGDKDNVFRDIEIEPYVGKSIQEIKPFEEFPRGALKTGMIVRAYDDKLAMVLLDTARGDIITGHTWTSLDRCYGVDYNSITEVYQPQSNMGFLPKGEISLEGCELLWKKPVEVVEEVTEAQVCELLGRKVKVVG